jgi:hypothetical protein
MHCEGMGSCRRPTTECNLTWYEMAHTTRLGYTLTACCDLGELKVKVTQPCEKHVSSIVVRLRLDELSEVSTMAYVWAAFTSIKLKLTVGQQHDVGWGFLGLEWCYSV